MSDRSAALEFVQQREDDVRKASTPSKQPTIDPQRTLAAIERGNLMMEEVEMTLPIGFQHSEEFE